MRQIVRRYSEMFARRGEVMRLSQLEDVVAERVLEGFATGEEALEFIYELPGMEAGSTREGFMLTKADIRWAVDRLGLI